MTKTSRKNRIRLMAAELVEAETHPDYKGRFFTEGFGFVTDDPVRLGAALALAYLDEHDRLEGRDPYDVLEDMMDAELLPERTDSMGLSRIFY